MFKEFNVEFQDVEMIGGADNLLENTKVTKVVMSGDNKMSSLDSAFKNCSELDNIQGGLDLNGVSNIDNILDGNNLIKNIDLKNVNNENISANNSFPNIEEITIGGELYNKKALQNVIASKEWTFDNITYSDVAGDNVTTKEVNVVDDNKLVIKDTLEQKAKEIEIKGQTYQNLIEGKGEYNLTDTYSATCTESNSSFEDIPDVVEIPEIFGNTVQGYANVLTPEVINSHWKKANWITNATIVNKYTINTKTAPLSSFLVNSVVNDNSLAIQLKANTTYTLKTECPMLGNSSYIYGIGGDGGVVQLVNLVSAKGHNIKNFTTTSTGKIIFSIRPDSESSSKDMKVFCVEGDVDLSLYDFGEFDLEYIQSVGDLYVDEEGNPILDEEGNEQYKLDVVSSNTLNLIDINEGCTKDGSEAYFNTVIDSSKVKKFTCIYKHNMSGHWFKPRAVSSEGVVGSVFISQQTTSSNVVSNGVYRIQFSVPSNVDRFVIQLSHFSGGNNFQVTVGHNTLPFLESVDTKQSNKATILLPIQLKGVDDVKDRLFYDYTKNKYVIEKRIGEFANVNNLSEAILDIGQIIESKTLEKLSLETYTPKTYISTNTEIQPSQMTITNKKNLINLKEINNNTDYTIQFKCDEKGDNPIKFNLCGSEKEVDVPIGVNRINITTPSELSDSKLELSGEGNKVSEVMVIEGEINQYLNYFDGIQSLGKLQEDGSYKIDIKTNEDFTASIKTDLPLTKDDKLYWNGTNKRYEIDRNGVIEIPIVEGDIIDLPRLYQRDDTILTVDTGNIKPSEIKIKYKDLN